MFYSEDSILVEKKFKVLAANAEKYRAFRKPNIPDYLHFGNNSRVGQILLIPEPPYVFATRQSPPSAGTHGFDPYRVENMGAIFYAWGPAFKKGMVVEPFENIHLFPMMAEVLNLNYDTLKIDGNIEVLKPILISRENKKGGQSPPR